MYRINKVALLCWIASSSTLITTAESNNEEEEKKTPNFIVMQPDDLAFFEDWIPPPHFPGNDPESFPPSSDGLPYMEYLRTNGVHMTQAYAASQACGTSRYSTITGRFPSRSANGRSKDIGSGKSEVTIPRTKLADISSRFVEDGDDCSVGNAGAIFQANGYPTGVFGKWHLGQSNRNAEYDYETVQQEIRECGFDTAEAIYKENLSGSWSADVTHNMEHVTSKAITFMDYSINDINKPFFMYFNPTVPHSSGDVTDALNSADCKVTVEGNLDEEPYIPFGMTADFPDCESYRKDVLSRGGDDDSLAGSVWVDDAIGSLLMKLEDMGQLNNTFFLFQLDHGKEGKNTMYEPGARIAQFVHFPDYIEKNSAFDGPVSTVDILPTMLDFAGITDESTGYYPMDGRSWKDAVVSGTESDTRCVVLEMGLDRAIRCGCHKYIQIDNFDQSDTYTKAERSDFALTNENYYNLCDENGDYVQSPNSNQESDGTITSDNEEVANDLKAILECYMDFTNPDNAPDYNIQCGDSALTTPVPVDGAAPTPSPSFQPSL